MLPSTALWRASTARCSSIGAFPLARGTIELEWRERDGATVLPPSREGFGHLVLTRLVPQALGGSSELEFLAEGFCWHLTFPVSHSLKAEDDRA